MTAENSSSANLSETVRTLIAQIIGVPRDMISGSSALGADLGATSLDSVEIIMAIEDAFEIEISDDRAASVVTVHDLESLVRRLQPTGRATIAA